MQEHDVAYGIIDDHPLVGGLDRFFRKHGIAADLIDFFSTRIFFAYPKTLWFRLFAEVPRDVKLRQALGSSEIGEVFAAWISDRAVFKRIVFDLRGITILDLDPLLAFFARARGDRANFYLCDLPLIPLLLHKGVDRELVRSSELAILHNLRNANVFDGCVVQPSQSLTIKTLDRALVKQAPRSELTARDLLVFDLNRATRLDFTAASMIGPIIHSTANTFGTLALVTNTRRKVRRLLEELGFWRTMSPYLLNGRSAIAPGTPAIFPLQTFTGDNLIDLQDRCAAAFDDMVSTFGGWFARVAKLTKLSRQVTINRTALLIRDLRQVIRELTENVALHSHGLGYIAMHFDAQIGLRIYVGDTGIGLARGLSRKYKLSVRSDVRAIELALSLREHKHKRRRLRGSFSYGGRGLDRIGLILGDLYGEMSIRSDTAMGTFVPAEGRHPVTITRRMYHVQGTHLHLLIPNQHP